MPAVTAAALLSMGAKFRRRLFAPEVTSRWAALTRPTNPAWVAGFSDPDAEAGLRHAEIVMTSWGSGPLTGELLDRAPRLRAVFHAAGSVRSLVTPACWERDLIICSAAEANARAAAEFTVASILYAGKRVPWMIHDYRSGHDKSAVHRTYADASNYRRVIGLVGLSRTGRQVAELLRPYDYQVIAYDPFADQDDADELDVTLMPLSELMASSDIVSIHAPALPTTYHLLGPAELALLQDGATLINTARPDLVDTDALIPELVAGRIYAILDVTDPEPLPASSVLHHLPNVQVTPHIAGAMGTEITRLSGLMVDEVQRYLSGEPLHHVVQPSDMAHIA